MSQEAMISPASVPSCVLSVIFAVSTQMLGTQIGTDTGYNAWPVPDTEIMF